MAGCAKGEMLARIRAALLNAPETPPAPRAYRRQDERDQNDLVAQLIDRLRDYKAHVERVEEAAGLPSAINALER